MRCMTREIRLRAYSVTFFMLDRIGLLTKLRLESEAWITLIHRSLTNESKVAVNDRFDMVLGKLSVSSLVIFFEGFSDLFRNITESR